MSERSAAPQQECVKDYEILSEELVSSLQLAVILEEERQQAARDTQSTQDAAIEVAKTDVLDIEADSMKDALATRGESLKLVDTFRDHLARSGMRINKFWAPLLYIAAIERQQAITEASWRQELMEVQPQPIARFTNVLAATLEGGITVNGQEGWRLRRQANRVIRRVSGNRIEDDKLISSVSGIATGFSRTDHDGEINPTVEVKSHDGEVYLVQPIDPQSGEIQAELAIEGPLAQ